ncbi:hypothetical protein [Aurantiacibacter sp. MUD61]|uniref:hypothetical protein n=1 Tax=Aurantiacibacter sp. MUD61 TaxID=3009083 RepID=UPI0022F087E1|nr:hypothetical protein [Aurantiacibacter sp. MUD61]
MSDHSRQKVFHLLASLSVLCSLTMLALAKWVGFQAFFPVVPINWLLFMATGYFAFPKGKFRFGQRMTGKNNLIFTVVMLTFTTCGLIAFAISRPDF